MAALPAAPGVYALVLARERGGEVRVGRLGVLRLRAGCYIYVGSAWGPGGLRARIGHHLRAAKRPRWHMDYLRARVEVRAVCCAGEKAWAEHEWAARIAALPGAEIPMAGFGSSDCRCASHLVYFASRPSPQALRDALGRRMRPFSG